MSQWSVGRWFGGSVNKTRFSVTGSYVFKNYHKNVQTNRNNNNSAWKFCIRRKKKEKSSIKLLKSPRFKMVKALLTSLLDLEILKLIVLLHIKDKILVITVFLPRPPYFGCYKTSFDEISSNLICWLS